MQFSLGFPLPFPILPVQHSSYKPPSASMDTSLEATTDWEVLSYGSFYSRVDQIRNLRSIQEIAALGTPFVRCEDDLWTLVHYFCDEGSYGATCSDDELLVHLLDLDIPIDARASDGSTALHLAARSGWISTCKLLITRGADIQAKDSSGETPLLAAIGWKRYALVEWLLEQQSRMPWDSALFKELMKYTPEVAPAYLDKFAVKRDSVQSDRINFEYFDLRFIYGLPHEPIDSTALAIAVKYADNKNMLNHRVMLHIAKVKFMDVCFVLLREMAAYAGLLLSYYATIIFANPDWINLKSSSDYAVMVLRAFAWLCCLYLVVSVEYSEFRGGNYLKSFWNWLNMIMYGAILATIPLEFIGGSTSSARSKVIALISVSLWINVLPYLSIHRKIGLLIASMGRMVHDVGQFFVLYSVFLFGFSGAFHSILSGSAGYETYLDTFITVLLMIFGNLNYDPYGSATGFQWFYANLLLFLYLVYVVIMLLNVLIALMSTSYSDITETAQDQYSLRCVEITLRIERSLSRSAREKNFRLLTVNLENGKATVAPAPTSDIAPNRTIDEKSNGESQRQAMAKVQPLGRIQKYDEPNTATKATRVTLVGLEDGVRYELIQPKKESLSAEMEERFESLRVDNQGMGAQIRELTSIILELQSQLGRITYPCVASPTSSLKQMGSAALEKKCESDVTISGI